MKTKFRQKLSCMLILGAVMALGGQAANAQTTVTALATVPHLEFTLGTPTPAASGATDTWSTAAAKVLGVTLLAQLDSSGPAVWSAAEHPLVYVTSNGPGYYSANTMSPTQLYPGVALFDANTYQPIASTAYKATGVTGYSENHGVGVSADGKWIYTQGNMPLTVSDMSGGAVLLVINAQTLKVDKIIRSRVHHVRNVYDKKSGKNLMLVDGWGTFFTLDPSNDNKVFSAVHPANLNGAGYLGFGNPAGTFTFISTRTGFLESEGGVAIVDQSKTDIWTVSKRIATYDASPIWVAFSANGKNAYVSGGEFSTVTKIDTSASSTSTSAWTATGIANAGGIGPYGLTLNWDDKTLYTISKGEASHNQGISMGVIDVSKFVEHDQYRGWGTIAGEVYTGCLRGDHAIVHPDPAKNELWISCNGTFDNVVMDMGDGTPATLRVKKILKNPNGGSSHGGAMVKYTVSGSTITGELLSDTGNLWGSAMTAKQARATLNAN